VNLQELTKQTIAEAAKLTKGILAGSIEKAITTTTGASGITGYILEAPMQQLVPLLSPFRQTIPRKTQPGATAVNWKVITSINIGSKFSTAENFSANGFTYSTSDKTAAFRVVGRLGSVTREAIAAAQNFDDAKAREVTNTLLQAMKEEEIAILGANRTALGTMGTVVVTVRSGLGSLAAAAGGLFVRVVALTLFGASRHVVDIPAFYNGTDAFIAGNAHASTAGTWLDVATDGVAIISAEVNSAAVSLNDALKITWPAVNNAFAYAVFVSSTTNTEKLEAIVTQTSITLQSLAGTGIAYTVARNNNGATVTLTGNDTSGDALIFDGLSPLINADTNAFKKNVNGVLTVTSSTGEVREINDAVTYLYNVWKIDDFRVVCGVTENRNITKGMIAAGGGPTIFVNAGGGNDRTEITMGYHVAELVSPTGKKMPVDILPWLPGGTLFILPTRLPFPMAGVEQPFEIAAGYGWEQLDYAMTPNQSAAGQQAAVSGTGPVSAFEVRSWACLKAYFPGGCAILTNIFNG